MEGEITREGFMKEVELRELWKIDGIERPRKDGQTLKTGKIANAMGKWPDYVIC